MEPKKTMTKAELVMTKSQKSDLARLRVAAKGKTKAELTKGQKESNFLEVPKSVWDSIPPVKKNKRVAISLRMEEDIITWFRELAGKGYQVHIETVLRSYRDHYSNKLK